MNDDKCDDDDDNDDDDDDDDDDGNDDDAMPARLYSPTAMLASLSPMASVSIFRTRSHLLSCL